ncbi:MAG: ECF-type sigma factor [Planctomycetota bacterium]
MQNENSEHDASPASLRPGQTAEETGDSGTSQDAEECAAIRALLIRVESGDEAARGELFEHLYSDLRGRAQRVMASTRPGRTLQPTLLVHEVFLKLMSSTTASYANEGHFLAVAARAMRQVVVDHVRAKDQQKRRAVGRRVSLEGIVQFDEAAEFDLEVLLEALEDLAEFDAPMARAVDLRLFGGCSSAEAARAIEVPLRTFQRRWADTVRWLRRRVGADD